MLKFYSYLPAILLFLFLGEDVQAQTSDKIGTIKGKVLSNKKNPISYVSVALLKGTTPVNGALTDDDGNFEITPTGEGTFTIKVSGIGFEDKSVENITVSKNTPVKDIGHVTVTITSNTLDAVKVKGERPLMVMGVDKKVFNVEKNITTAGGSASDVLQNIPSVGVDIDGGVSLRGKSGVTILIDGKPSTLLGDDVASALQSLPASSIDQVEVITNPSAKYDAQGMTGIINIITKREKKFGLNGSVRAGAGTRDKYNGGLSLNLKNDKWNVFLNSNFRQDRKYRRNTTDRENTGDNANYHTFDDKLRNHGGFFNSIGAEYIFDDNNSITLTQNFNWFTYASEGKTSYQVFAGDNIISTQDRYSKFKVSPFSSSTTLEHKYKFAPLDHTLTTSATYVKSNGDRIQFFNTNNYDATGQLVGGPVVQDAPGNGGRSTITAQTDYERPLFFENGKLETGLKAQLFSFVSDNRPTIDSPGISRMVDSTLLNSYDYVQNIYAAYASFKDQRGKFRYQLGLRTEYTVYEGTNESVGGRKYTNEFLNLFPSVFTSYELPKDQSIYLSYSRRINRPRFWQLLPYVDLSNPQDTSVGNPDLLPEFIHNIELSYNKLFKQGHNFLIGVYYQNTQNLITHYRVFYQDGTSFNQRRNLNTGITYGLELTSRVQIVKIWDATFNVNLFQNQIQGNNVDPTIDNSGFSWFGKMNTNVQLPLDFSLQINVNYDAPKIEPQGTREGLYWIDAAIRKNLFKDKATLVLNVSDIFNTRKYTNEYDFGYAVQTQYRDRETRIGNITFSYRFGKSDMGNRRQKDKGSLKPQDADRDKNIKDNSGDGGGF